MYEFLKEYDKKLFLNYDKIKIENAIEYCKANDIPKKEYDDFGYFKLQKREKLEKAINRYDIDTIVELGTMVGKSAIWFSKFEQIKKIYCIDIFQTDIRRFREQKKLEKYLIKDKTVYFLDAFLSNCLDDVENSKKIHFLQTKTLSGIMKLATQNIDGNILVYIDAGHTFYDCYNDLALSNYIFPNAVLCVDDYTSHCGVKKATDQFSKAYKVKVIHD